MTLIQMYYFCAAARTRSITKASELLFVTQPTVSIAVKELEKEFGFALFTHSGNTLSLTAEGERLYNRAAQIVSMCDDLRADFASLAASPRRVHVGIPPMLGTLFFPALSDAFAAKNPDIALELEEAGSQRACDMVQDELLDAALVNMETQSLDKFHSHCIVTEPLDFAVSRDSHLSRLERISLQSLHQQNVILYNQDSVQNRVLLSMFNALKVSPNVIMKSSQLTTILNFVRRGQAGVFLYRDMLPLFPDLVALPTEPVFSTRAGVIWKKGRYVSSSAEKFINFCKSYRPDF